jgi:hypothetical protein
VFCKKLDNFKNKPAGVLKIFYDQAPTLPSSDDITRFDGTLKLESPSLQRRLSPANHTLKLFSPKRYGTKYIF